MNNFQKLQKFEQNIITDSNWSELHKCIQVRRKRANYLNKQMESLLPFCKSKLICFEREHFMVLKTAENQNQECYMILLDLWISLPYSIRREVRSFQNEIMKNN